MPATHDSALLQPRCARRAGDVDFSIPVYREITGMWPHRLRVQWEWSDCSPMIEGNILLTPKVGPGGRRHTRAGVGAVVCPKHTPLIVLACVWVPRYLLLLPLWPRPRATGHTTAPALPVPLQDGINPQWQAFYFANAKYPLKTVRLNGMDLQRSEFQVGGTCTGSAAAAAAARRSRWCSEGWLGRGPPGGWER